MKCAIFAVLLWVAAGSNDTLAGPGTKHLAEILDSKGIKHEFHESEGGHTWINWRHYLNDYAQLLVESADRSSLHQFLDSWLPRVEQLPSARRVRWALDVDPMELF